MLRTKRKTSDSEDDQQPIISAETEETKQCQMTLCQKGYPKHVFFIIGNEFCERFCFYGMKAVLQTYLIFQYRLSVDSASSLFHAFTMIAYFMPFFGALLADALIGRYWTIVSLSSVYVIGNLIMATTAIGNGYLVGALVGMFTIAVGTGGIKPCVSAFGADQFPSSMAKAQETFFSLFYVSINAGALLSQIITPEVKSMSCFGYDYCWVLAFGLPAVLMITALILFLIGTPFYRRVAVSGDSALKLFKAVGIAFVRLFRRNKQHADHWLDRAVGPDISQSFVDDCKAVFRVFVLFLPLPFFWALFDQQGSRWTLQAQKMNSYLEFANWSLEAEQIQIFNGLLVVLCVPFFEMVVYPVAKKANFLVKPLQRMVAGCVLASISFFIIGFIQIAVQRQNDALIKDDFSTYRVRTFNLHERCSFNLTREDGSQILSLGPRDSAMFKLDEIAIGGKVNIASDCPATCLPKNVVFGSETTTPISSLTISNNCNAFLAGNSNSFPDAVEYLFQIQAALYSFDKNVAKMSLVPSSGQEIHASFEAVSNDFVRLNYSEFNKPGRYKLNVEMANGTIVHSDDFLLMQGGAYSIVYGLQGAEKVLVDKGPNGISVFWQFFPYLVLTWSEIMFSITGLSFAFSQAPDCMKSILQAAWLLTVSFGNTIDIIVVNLKIPDKAVEFFVFAITMCIVTVIFALMTYCYKYVDSVYGKEAAELKPVALDKSENNKDKKTCYGALQDTTQSPKDSDEATDNC